MPVGQFRPGGFDRPVPRTHDAANGKYYLLWKAAGKIGVQESRLLATELGTNGKPKPGAPVVTLLVTNRSAPWEGGTIEAPAMIQYAGRTTSSTRPTSPVSPISSGHSNYATGYAICPQGPLAACTRPDPSHPLLSSNGIDQGPGGATPFLDTNGGLHLAYSSFWLGENRNGVHPRRLHVTPLTALPNGLLWAGVNGSPPKVQPTGWGSSPVPVIRAGRRPGGRRAAEPRSAAGDGLVARHPWRCAASSSAAASVSGVTAAATADLTEAAPRPPGPFGCTGHRHD